MRVHSALRVHCPTQTAARTPVALLGASVPPTALVRAARADLLIQPAQGRRTSLPSSVTGPNVDPTRM